MTHGAPPRRAPGPQRFGAWLTVAIILVVVLAVTQLWNLGGHRYWLAIPASKIIPFIATPLVFYKNLI